MTKTARDPHRRTIWIIALAVVLPASIIIAMDLSFGLARERDKIEQKSLSIAEKLSLLVDARVQADLAAISALSTATSLKTGDLSAFYQRAVEIRNLMPGWFTVILSDPATKRELLDLRRPLDAKERPIDPGLALRVRSPHREIGGILHSDSQCRCIPLDVHVARDKGQARVITVLLDPGVFQNDLTAHAAGRFAMMADHDAFIVARWQDISTRLATRASDPVRQAIAKGGSGIFFGRTLEGVETLTAYVVSPFTGWSVHIGVPLTLVDTPYMWSLVAGAAALTAAFAIAAFLVVYAIRDLAARRSEGERALQTQKMEAIGRLTGGIAHDFNNLLTVVIGNLELLAKRLPGEELRRLVDRADSAARRGAKLVAQLLAFSRSHELEIVAVDLRSLLNGMRDLLEQSLGTDVGLRIQIVDPQPLVMSDVNQLELALLNLAINARDAMSGQGHFGLRVEAGRRDPRGSVTIVADDTGSGMSKDVAARAFEPFFTTKEAGRGTGLGLAQVFATVSRSGGTIELDSDPGRGTTFLITLPRAHAGQGSIPHQEDVTRPQEALGVGASCSTS